MSVSVYGADVGALGLPMPAKPLKAEKPQRITWRDWQPQGTPDPDELMTREEFVARLNDLAVDVTKRDLVYWESLEVLPRGIRKRSNQITRVYYPRWLMASIELLRTLQSLGWSLEAIGPRLRGTAAEAIQVARETDDTPLRPSRPGQPAVSTRGDVVLLNWAQTLAEDDRLAALSSRTRARAFETEITRLARHYGADVVRIAFLARHDGEERLLHQQEIPLS